jgi:galactokinase
METESIPVYTTVSEIYPDLKVAVTETHRWNTLASEFETRFGHRASHICRAPGRVNLIGEHIDYCLFGVFPAAIDRDILIACGRRPAGITASSKIDAQNSDTKYPPKLFEATVRDGKWQLDIDTSKLSWESYVKAGYYGVLNHFFPTDDSGLVAGQPEGFDLLISSTLPPGSGLSSSAAVVVVSTLAFLVMNKKLDKVSKGDLVRLAVENERRVGVNSGGMDQAASVLSLFEHALYISFHPKLSPNPIPLPTSKSDPPTSFVIANSLKVADKAVSAKIHYNLRVVETLVGARVLAKGLGIKVGDTEKVTLREVLDRWAGIEVEKDGNEDVGKLRDALKLIDEKVESILGAGNGKNGLTFDEMVQASGLSVGKFKEVYLSWVEVEATHFQLYRRAKHVFSEALRVLEFREVCLTAPTEKVHLQLGKLMNDSQESCRDFFDCSCPELDELTKLARGAGAFGSRLTGAGWGGCTVSLVAEAEVQNFIAKVKQQYAPYKSLSDLELEGVIFATKPGSGAAVFKFE